MTTRRALLVFAFTFLVVAAVYRRAPIAFLRAESGWYVRLSHDDEATQRAAVRGFFTGSYGGHYTPLAFLSEFTMARIAGTSRAFWKWRQLLALSAVGASLFGLVLTITRALALPKTEGFAIAGAIATLMLFQPAMVDFVTWPFMILQLAWLGLSVGTLFCLVKTLETNDAIWPWLAAAAAYASLHLSGLGLATIAATATSLGWWAFRVPRIRLLRPCGLMLAFALVHAVMMAQPATGWATIAQPSALISSATLGLGFIFIFVLSGLRSFTLTSASVPHPVSIAYCWPLGLLLVSFVTIGLFHRLRAARFDSSSAGGVATMSLVFSATGVGTMLLLIAGRQLVVGKGADSLLPYFTVMPRYIIPLQFLLLAPILLALVWLARRLPRFVIIGCCAFIPAAATTQFAYQQNAMAFLTVGTRASHYTCWSLLVSAARECRAAGLGLPNFSLAPLTREFSEADVQVFLPLLRHDLHLARSEKIELVPVQDYRASDPERYRLAPSVKAFEQKLELARD